MGMERVEQRQGDLNAIHRIVESHPGFSGSSQAQIAAAGIALADAQLVIARRLGFEQGACTPKDQHIFRISNNDQELLDELMAIQDL